MYRGAWPFIVHGVAKSWTQLSDFTFTFHFHALEKEMATHSSVLAWRIPGMGKPGCPAAKLWELESQGGEEGPTVIDQGASRVAPGKSGLHECSRGSASLPSSHGRGIRPQSVLKKDS